MTGFFGTGFGAFFEKHPEAETPKKDAMPTSSEIADTLRNSLPDNHAQFADAYAVGALANIPLRISAIEFALLLAGVCDRESRAGMALSPKGPAGTGDHAPRFYRDIPAWANNLGLVTGRQDENGKYEIVPPAYAGANIAGWGYGLMQIDFVSHRKWLDSTDWRDPFHNINQGASILSDAIESFGDIRLGVAAYNAGISAVRKNIDDPDSVTTDNNYSADVLARAGSYGFTLIAV